MLEVIAPLPVVRESRHRRFPFVYYSSVFVFVPNEEEEGWEFQRDTYCRRLNYITLRRRLKATQHRDRNGEAKGGASERG